MGRNALRRGLGALAAVLIAVAPAAAQNDNVTVDDQPTAEQRLAEINDLRAAGRYDDAAEMMQELIDGARFKLVGIGEGLYADAERWTREELLRDADLRDAYRERYTATAARAVGLAAAQPDPVPELREAYRRFAVTLPGLEAGVLLAGRFLEGGDIYAAGSLVTELERHPDRDQFAHRLLLLRGAVSAYIGDPQDAGQVAEQLASAGQNQQADQLTQWIEALAGEGQSGWSGLVDAGERPEELRISLWDQPLTTVEDRGSWVDARYVLPVPTQELVLTNNGQQVLAFDRSSGQQVWAYPPEDEGALPFNRDANGLRWHDTRGVGVGEGAVFAVLGDCYGITDNRSPYVPANRLVCLDQETGELLWERKAGELFPGEPTMVDDRRAQRANLQQTHLVGTPIVSHGQVLVMLRRANKAQSTQTNWLLAFDAKTMELRWYRHLALVTLYYGSDADEVTPQMTLAGDSVYVTDSIAVAGAIDVSSGGYRWLTVLADGTRRSGRLNIETQGVMAPPVVTSAGLVVPLTLDRQRLFLLDPEDGTVLRDFNEDPVLRSTQYVLDADDGVVVVTLDTIARWDAGEGKVAWTFPLDNGEKPTGRGDVSRRFAVVPTSRRVLVIDNATGRLIDEVPAFNGNVLIRDGEVLATADDRVFSYMSWDRAYQRLVQKVQDQPADPTAGIALASLALRQGGQTEAVMQGVEYALAAIDRQPPIQAEQTRQRVFDRLRVLALHDTTGRAGMRRMLYDRLALATQTAEQEAAYHLDFGAFLAEQGEAPLAVEHFQAVMVDPVFAAQPYELDGRSNTAGAVAQRKLYELVDRYGRSVYARYDALARARLDELLADDQTPPVQFALIAQRYPLALAASEALMVAGDRLERQGETIGAAGFYQQAVARATQPDQLRVAAGRLLAFYLDRGQTDRAVTLLDRIEAGNPDLDPLATEGPLSIRLWRERIASMPDPVVARPPLAARFEMPRLIEGRLIGPAPGIDPSAVTGRIFLHHPDGTVTCHEPGQPNQPLWSVDVPVTARQLVLLSDGGEQVLLASPDQGFVIGLNAQTGQALWPEPVDLSVMNDPARPEAGPPGLNPSVSPYLFVLSDTVLCLAHRRTGGVLTVDRHTGRVMWRATGLVPEITALSADAWSLAVAGRIGSEPALNHGRVHLLDLFTGEPMLDAIDLHVSFAPRFVSHGRGQLIVCGDDRVAAFDDRSGSGLWTYAITESRLTGVCAVAGNLLGAQTEDGQVHVISTARGGLLIGREMVGGGDANQPFSLRGLDGRLWVCGPRGASCLGQDPLMQWRDVLQRPIKKTYRLLIGDQRVAMIAATNDEADPDRVAVPGRGVSYDLLVMDKAGGVIQSHYTLGPIEGQVEPRGALLFGGGLALPVGDRTLIVPPAAVQAEEPVGGAGDSDPDLSAGAPDTGESSSE